MSDEDLEVLITLDDPEDPEKEDTFHNLDADNTVVRPACGAGNSIKPGVKRSGTPG
jgi:hypothetical protein